MLKVVELYFNTAGLCFCMAVCCLPACASTDVAGSELAQGHIRSQSARLTLILLPFYRELKKIKAWNMLKDEGYFQPWSH
uniref:Secreted protein n=1 Tax=Strix occidentalis caurina TaxID=311401 RepID=A0A8D0ETB0_STROC